MPSNAGTIGTDFSIQYYDGLTGQLQDLGDVQSFNMVPMAHELKNMPYNGAPIYDYMDDGHKCDFTITMTDSRWDDFQAAREANTRAGKKNTSGILNKSIIQSDGVTTKRYQYTNFVFRVTHSGDVSREKLVTIKGEGYASTMIPIA